MSLYASLARRAAEGRPVRVGLIGTGRFGTMFLSQARLTTGLHVVAVADLDEVRARASLRAAGWPDEQIQATSPSVALARETTHIAENADAVIEANGVDVVVEATGDPVAGVSHALACAREGRHVAMVNVEADALAGPVLARAARSAGVVYSLAWGDQPALICELVDWARTCGFEVACAGKGTKHHASFRRSTPDTVWPHYGTTTEKAAATGNNAKMFNSFVDGRKSAIEMAAVANATGLGVPADGLSFPSASVEQLADVFHGEASGGSLARDGLVEVVSCLQPDGSPVERDLRWGVFVVFKATGDYAARCLPEYGVTTDRSGRYAALYRPFHLIGLELGISIASIVLRGEPTGCPTCFNADVVAVAKRELAAGERLDGEGGYAVWGRLMPAADSIALGALPVGLTGGIVLENAVAEGEVVRWTDVRPDRASAGVMARRELERGLA